MTRSMVVEKVKMEEMGLSLRQENTDSPVVIEIGSVAELNPAKHFLSAFSRELWREIKPATKTVVLLIAVFLLSLGSFLGYQAYRDRQESRRLLSTQSGRLDEHGKKIAEQDNQLVSLREQITQSNQQLLGLNLVNQEITNTIGLAPKLWSTYSSGVCFLAGSYVLIDPATNKPLRYPEHGDEGSESERLLTIGTGTTVTPDGNGPILEMEFVGTGFNVGNGFILTNRHIASEPWKADMRAQYLIPLTGAKPRMQRLLAFFPGHVEPYRLKFKRASQEVDLAVCVFDGMNSQVDIPILPLDRDGKTIAVGNAVVMMGFPSGPDRMLALLPDAESADLQNRYGESLVTLLEQLGRRKLIKPLTTQGHITDLFTNRIVFDAATSEGASGTPMFGQSGRVIGVTFAIFSENRASNLAVPISKGIALLESTGWRQAKSE